MIGVYITINGRPIFARTAVNRVAERGVYVADDGLEIKHDPAEGAVALAIKLLESIQDNPDKAKPSWERWMELGEKNG